MEDFNAELGSAWHEQGSIISKFHLHQGAVEPFDNGARLFNLVIIFHLRATNTFFKHRLGHLATWHHIAIRHCYVKDYILVSNNVMQGVNDCHVFFSMNHRPINHHLLVLSLQLHLRALKHDALARRGLWDGALLRELGRRIAFGQEVGNRFVVLPSQAPDLEKEWGRFVTGVSATATKMIGTQGLVQRNCLELSLGMLELVTVKWAAHLARLSCLHSVIAQTSFRLTNMRVKAIVSRDA
jgi:hypothetical protein